MLASVLWSGRAAATSRLSSDGTRVVGWSSSESGFEAYLWDAVNGMQGLGGIYSHANAISADGAVVVGQSAQEAWRWDAANGMQGLGFVPGGNRSEAYDVSSDGTTIVGTSGPTTGYGSSYDSHAFFWTQAGGMQEISFAAPSNSYAYSVSGDGSLVVGEVVDPALQHRAFIWDATNGMRYLDHVLADDYGLDPTGWKLVTAYAISDDGTAIAGAGENPSGEAEAWLFTLPEPATPVALLFGAAFLAALRWEGRLVQGALGDDPRGTVAARLQAPCLARGAR